jgi:competence protein ComEA
VGAAVLFGVRVAWARAAAAPQPVAAHGAPSGLVSRSVPAGFASGGAAAAGASGAAGAAGVLPTAAAEVIVDVVGQVHHPGVVRLRPGSRVLDAVAAAGGALPAADLGHVNLARPLTDGEQIVVPRPGEVVSSSSAAGTAGGPGGAAGAGGVVDLNAADLAALDGLPGVGPVLAQRILDWRTQHGRFSTVDELGEVSGIGDKLLAQLKPKVRV